MNDSLIEDIIGAIEQLKQEVCDKQMELNDLMKQYQELSGQKIEGNITDTED